MTSTQDASASPTRILLIEDDLRFTRALIVGLEDVGFDVHHSADGLEGWDLARSPRLERRHPRPEDPDARR